VTPMRDVLVRLIVKHPWKWLVAMLAITACLAPFVVRIPFVFDIAEMFATDDPAVEPNDRFRALFGRDDNIVIIAWSDPELLSPAGIAKIERISNALEEHEGVDSVLSLTTAKEIRGTDDGFGLVPLVELGNVETMDFAALLDHLNTDPLWQRMLVGEKGDATAIVVQLEHDVNHETGREKLFASIDKMLVEEGGEYHWGGVPVIRSAFVGYMKHDVRTFIPLTIVVCLFLTYLLYRNFRPVLLILVINVGTVIWTFGLMGLAGGSINIITIALPTLLMVMGTAYGVHLVGRYIEELSAGKDRDEAVATTLRHLTLAIFMTSLTTGVGFLSLLVMRVRLVRMFGIYAALGVMVAFAITIMFLGPMLLKLKPLGGATVAGFGGDRFRRYLLWNWRVVRERKYLVAAISGLLAVASIYGITQIEINARLMIEMDPKSKEYVANDFLEEHLAGVISLNLMVVGEPDAFLQPEMLRKLDKVYTYAREGTLANGEPAVDHALAFSEIVKVMNMAMHEGAPAYRRIPQFTPEEGGEVRARQAVAQYLLLYGDPDDFSGLVTPDYHAARLVLRLKDRGTKVFRPIERDLLTFARETFGDDATVEVVGETVMAGYIVNRLVRDMTKSLVLAAFVIVLVFFALFRSLRLGLLAMIPNILPLVVTMAALGYLGVVLRTSIVMVFSISLGIAVDDTIHFVTRLRSESRQGKSLDEAIGATFLGTGRAIVFTSVILFAGFSLLIFGSFLPSRNFGWLSALTMVTALIGDMFLLPALIYIFKPNLK
jgi:uncharacterized protein